MLDPEIVKILRCPVSQDPLEMDEKNQRLICRSSGLAYPIRNGIAVLLATEAIKLDND